MSFWLEHDQDGQRQKYPFDAPSITIGRDQSADFLLDHPTVSRQHARIVSQGGNYRLVVLSQGGLTAINGSAVSGEVSLNDGSALQFGQFSFVFRTDAPARPSGPQSASPSGGFGSAPSSGGFGQQGSANSGGFGTPASGGFGSVPSSGGFGTPPSGGFGTPSSSSGFGTPPSSSGFGTPPSSSGFGAPPASGGFGSPPSSSGFGAPPASGGFGSPPSSGGTAPASGGFGSPASGGFGTPPSSSFGSPPASGGFGSPASGGFGSPASSGFGPAESKPRDDNHIVSWDEIAQSEEALEGKVKAETDFERLEAAQKKAREGTKKTNPLLLVVLLFAVIGTGAFVFYEPAKKGPEGATPVEQIPPLRFQGNEVDCVGEAECLAKAEQQFIVANELAQKVEVDIRNRFDAYFKYELALEMLKKGGFDQPPAKFAGIQTNRDRLRGELDAMFQQRRVRYHDLSKRKMYREMVAILNEVQAIFPYKGAREYIWAVQLERQLKDQNLYPNQLF